MTWNPNSKEFGVVYGYMPAKTTIFNVRGSPKHSFALGPRNTILFSPHGGRFVLVAGFGNLAGQMDIYDMEKNYNKIATVEASNSSVCEWSPDGRYILTATTSPRLRVDNGIRIWHVTGALMYNEDMHELYQVCWRPQSTTQHPPLSSDPLKNLPTPHPSAVAYMSTRKVPQKAAGAYRPPGARGQGTPLAFKREDEGGTALLSGASSPSAGGKPRKKEVPGVEAVEKENDGTVPPGFDPTASKLSSSASKNKKKREARKFKDAVADGQLPPPPSNATHQSPDRRAKKAVGKNGNGAATNGAALEEEKKTPSSAPTPTTPAAAADARGGDTSNNNDNNGGVQDKKIRGLLKKMRAIDELKMRLAGGEKLEDTQMKKILSEDSVRKDLEAAGY